jgi:hypothetical protein
LLSACCRLPKCSFSDGHTEGRLPVLHIVTNFFIVGLTKTVLNPGPLPITLFVEASYKVCVSLTSSLMIFAEIYWSAFFLQMNEYDRQLYPMLVLNKILHLLLPRKEQLLVFDFDEIDAGRKFRNLSDLISYLHKPIVVPAHIL